jgi:hypothetical protein
MLRILFFQVIYWTSYALYPIAKSVHVTHCTLLRVTCYAKLRGGGSEVDLTCLDTLALYTRQV